MNLEGKTIARVEDYGDTIYFTDGTALGITSDDGHYLKDLGWSDVQERLHEAQGRRERDRMQRLEGMLHPRDREMLARLRRERQERARAEWEKTATPMQRAFRDVMGSAILDMQRDFSRSIFTIPVEPPKKRKARRS